MINATITLSPDTNDLEGLHNLLETINQLGVPDIAAITGAADARAADDDIDAALGPIIPHNNPTVQALRTWLEHAIEATLPKDTPITNATEIQILVPVQSTELITCGEHRTLEPHGILINTHPSCTNH